MVLYRFKQLVRLIWWLEEVPAMISPLSTQPGKGSMVRVKSRANCWGVSHLVRVYCIYNLCYASIHTRMLFIISTQKGLGDYSSNFSVSLAMSVWLGIVSSLSFGCMKMWCPCEHKTNRLYPGSYRSVHTAIIIITHLCEARVSLLYCACTQHVNKSCVCESRP